MTTALLLVFAPHIAKDDADVPLVNHERSIRGIRLLIEDPSLDALALQHSEAMAARGQIYHDPSTSNHAGVWLAYGENVGAGPSLQAIHNAYMSSPEHRANILDPIFDHIGTAEVTRNGVVYNTEIFVERPSPSPPPAPRPKPRKPRARPRPTQTPSTCVSAIVPVEISSITIKR